MSTLKDVWASINKNEINRDGFASFLQLLSIELSEIEITQIFTMLDIEKTGTLTYDDIRIFFNMTKVYDKTKYPKPQKVKRRSSYKIHPE